MVSLADVWSSMGGGSCSLASEATEALSLDVTEESPRVRADGVGKVEIDYVIGKC